MTGAPLTIIVDQIDVEHLRPGGIDSIVRDMILYSNCEFCIIGVSSNRPLGRSVTVTIGNKTVIFIPVCRPRDKALLRLPDSLRLGLGVLLFYRHIPEGIMHTHRAEVGALAALLRRRHIQFIHNDELNLTGRNSDSFWRYLPRTYRALERIAVNSSDTCICFSLTAAKRLSVKHRSVHRHKSWYDPSLFWPHLVPSRRYPSRQFVIAWAGRLDNQKDPMLAIEVADVLRSSGISFLIKMAGDGVLSELLQAEIAHRGLGKHVELLGPLSREQVAEHFREADVTLMTSHYEGSPLTLIESCACGTPVVCTVESDPDCVIKNNINGNIVANRSAGLLAEAILGLPDDLGDRCVQIVAGRRADLSIPELMSRLRPSDDS